MQLMYRLRKILFNLTPKYNSTIYTACKRYVDHYNGDNNSNMLANGEINFIKGHAENWNTVFDVGAHRGHWTQAVLSVNSEAQVHCFEPFPDVFKILLSNNFHKQVHLNQLALSVSAGTSTMYVRGINGCNSLYDRQWTFDGSREDHETITIQMTSVDEYCHKHNIEKIDMMKMDVEGSEMNVLRGADEMLRQGKIGCIQFEYDRSYIDAKIWLRDMFELLQPLGYQMGKIYPGEVKIYPKYDQRLENFANANWVAQLKSAFNKGD
jgi:FkbM family methyltransferase